MSTKRKKIFYVENQTNHLVLNKSGGWSRMSNSISAKFDTEEEARSVFPAGVPCEVIFRFVEERVEE